MLRRLGAGTASLYDTNGDLTNLWSGTAGAVTNVYQYDALNRLTNVQGDGGGIASYGFDGVGNLQSGTFGNGVTNLYQYDKLNRLTNAVWNLGSSARASFYYKLGLTGNRTNLNETIQGTNHLYNWQCDPIYRLTNENISTAGTVAYGLDAVGNRTNRTSSVTGLADQTQAYNTNDWLTTDAYDSNGNTIWTTNGGTPIGPYEYDAENHLTNFETVAITYNGDGLRASKSVGGTTIYYLLDDRNPTGYAQVLEEWSSTGGSPALSKVYNYGLSLISQRVPNSSTNYFIFDGHGSTRILTDSGGGVVNAFVYDAYGNLIASNTTAQTLYLFCSEQWDPDLNQYYLRARTYDSGTGRFWTGDTVEGSQEDPLSIHKYLYCEANPVDGSDPSGNDDLDSMLFPAYSAAFASSLNVLETIGAVPILTAPHRVLVVTLPNGTQYTPLTKVKNNAQASTLGLVIGTPIRIPVPDGVNPQYLVDKWRSGNWERFFAPIQYASYYFWVFRPGGPNDWKLRRPYFDAYGNFEFGACGAAGGIKLKAIQWAGDEIHHGRNNPINKNDIQSGYLAISGGGRLSTKVESLQQ